MIWWQSYHWELSSLREPDSFAELPFVSALGKGVPSTLFGRTRRPDGDRVIGEISSRLATLVDGVKEVRVNRDNSRRQTQVMLVDKQDQVFPAASLSDGTLRLMALSVLEWDSGQCQVCCIEEPESGIHPERMSAMMDLLKAIATDVDFAIDENNPLRQVIISTHSPVIVAQANPGDVLIADLRDPPSLPGAGHRAIVLKHCPGTWRASFADSVEIDPGRVVSYLASAGPRDDEDGQSLFKSIGARFSLQFGEDK